jgi:hypothetical protein
MCLLASSRLLEGFPAFWREAQPPSPAALQQDLLYRPSVLQDVHGHT